MAWQCMALVIASRRCFATKSGSEGAAERRATDGSGARSVDRVVCTLQRCDVPPPTLLPAGPRRTAPTQPQSSPTPPHTARESHTATIAPAPLLTWHEPSPNRSTLSASQAHLWASRGTSGPWPAAGRGSSSPAQQFARGRVDMAWQCMALVIASRRCFATKSGSEGAAERRATDGSGARSVDRVVCTLQRCDVVRGP
ncbi:hypothetical protein DAPPUDRAFT_126220 [Daphnia pulex]|uniref:Uncharacterized protein n=1 Tax=Daphnia pulex TaxID=6669 RepID=E9I7V5_DAPPU|nr:hypothetical protein DAPPUDRAFT_126220 [Daphnia pulex]|eukprot:EFX59925.1 hypothetical protein DAPPUDRAFT_126220 [Daphnia pulex]